MFFRYVSFGFEFIEFLWVRVWRSSELCFVIMLFVEIGLEWFFFVF